MAPNYVLIVIFDHDLKRVLMQHKTHGPACTNGKLNCPGGKVEVLESFKLAAIRELKEETGIVRDDLTWLVMERFANNVDLSVYCTQLEPDEQFEQLEEEILMWYNTNELINVRDDRLAGYGNVPYFIELALRTIRGEVQ
jgi:8-oxo-dGTP pyrophosphatase MutT (NUDIX family)